MFDAHDPASDPTTANEKDESKLLSRDSTHRLQKNKTGEDGLDPYLLQLCAPAEHITRRSKVSKCVHFLSSEHVLQKGGDKIVLPKSLGRYLIIMF